MTDQMKDGGAAFPRGGFSGPRGYGTPTDGMTLRDWLAGHALNGMLAHGTRYRPRDGASANWHEAITEEAYQIADAMLKAREAKP